MFAKRAHTEKKTVWKKIYILAALTSIHFQCISLEQNLINY